MAIYLTSDWHFGHDREFIWKARGYSSVEEMNEDQIYFVTTAQTKHLLGLLKRIRAEAGNTGYYWNGTPYTYDIENVLIPVRYYKKGGIEVNIELSADQIRTELRNREDMPDRSNTRKAIRVHHRRLKAWEAR